MSVNSNLTVSQQNMKKILAQNLLIYRRCGVIDTSDLYLRISKQIFVKNLICLIGVPRVPEETDSGISSGILCQSVWQSVTPLEHFIGSWIFSPNQDFPAKYCFVNIVYLTTMKKSLSSSTRFSSVLNTSGIG